MRLFLMLVLSASAWAQSGPDTLPPSEPDAARLWYSTPVSCDAAVPMPPLDLGADMADVMPEAELVGQPVPMPNLCAEPAPLAVLPQGVRFRLDPLPPSSSDSPGRQLLRELELERQRDHYRLLENMREINADAFRQKIGHPEFERIVDAPMVAPSGQRP